MGANHYTAGVPFDRRRARDAAKLPWMYGLLRSGVYSTSDVYDIGVSVRLAYTGDGSGLVSPKVIQAEFAAAHKAGRSPDVGRESVAGIPTAHAIKPDDMPSDLGYVKAPDAESAVRATFNAATLGGVIAWCAPAISTEETRYYLNGVFFHTEGQEGAATMRAVATDGHRLHMDSLALASPVDNAHGIIVPRLTLAILAKACALYPGEAVEMTWCDARVRYTVGPVVITSKVIDGTFPDYMRVIPDAGKCVESFTLDPVAFAATLARAKMIRANAPAGEKPPTPALALLETSPGNLEFRLVNFDGGDDPDRCAAGFNLAYVGAAMAGGDAPTMIMEDGLSPSRITFAGRPERLCVLMPMRIANESYQAGLKERRKATREAERAATVKANAEWNKPRDVPYAAAPVTPAPVPVAAPVAPVTPEPVAPWSPAPAIEACEKAIRDEMIGDYPGAWAMWLVADERLAHQVGDNGVELDSGVVVTRLKARRNAERLAAIMAERSKATIQAEFAAGLASSAQSVARCPAGMTAGDYDRIEAADAPATEAREPVAVTRERAPKDSPLYGRETPWGRADHIYCDAPGVNFFSTPSHGGYCIEGDALAAMPALLVDGCGMRFGGRVWFEEDCGWVAVAHVFPQFFTPDERGKVERTMREWFPYVWEKMNGRRLDVSESAALRLYANPNFHGGPSEPDDRPPATVAAPESRNDSPCDRAPVEIDLSTLPSGPPWDGVAYAGTAD